MRSQILVALLIASTAWLFDAPAVHADRLLDGQRAVDGNRAIERGALSQGETSAIDAGDHAALVEAAIHVAGDMIVAPGRLNMRTGDVVTAALPNMRDAPPDEFVPSRRYVVQLDSPITPERRAQLENIGVVLGDYLPTYAYIADLSNTDHGALRLLNFVTWLGPYRSEWKVEPEIGTREFTTEFRTNLAVQGRVLVDVTIFEGMDMEAAIEAVAAIPGVHVFEETVGEINVFAASIPLEHVNQLALLDEVQFVEEVGEMVPRRNNSVRGLVQTNSTSNTIFYANNLRGEGQIVGILDTLLDPNHCSFFDSVPFGSSHRKIQAYNSSTGAQQHGTHVGGIVVGDAGSNTNTRGVAYMGRLVYNTMPSLGQTSVYSRHSTHQSQGARIHTNSWGDGAFNTSYTGASRAIDRIMRDFEEALVVHSVANSSNPGTTISNPENAKSLLAVGATSKTNTNNHCTAKPGPTADGRRKPEVFAPGCNVNSAANSTSCSTTSLSGTSMATPATAGLAMLIRQYYTQGYYPTGSPVPANSLTPSGALVKATIVNSAQRMTGSGTGSGYPNFVQGWGRVHGDFSVHFPGQARRMIVHDQRNTVGLTTGLQAEHNFEVLASSEQLRVTLAFTDVAGAAGASNPVVNDLDLEVIAPNGAVYRGNHFVNNISATGGTKDPINSVEQVHINNPPTGDWKAIVRAAAVNSQLQGYALVVTGLVDSDDVVIPPPVPGNNTCTSASVASAGSTAINTLGATTEGPNEPNACSAGGSTQVHNDLWYRTTAGCTGTLNVKVIDCNFDARVALYGATCPAGDGTASACDTSACGGDGASVSVNSGNVVRIRIGSGSEGTVGSGTMVITCTVPQEPTCTGDIDGDNKVDGFDLLLLLSDWGPCANPDNCPADLDNDGKVDGFDLLLLLSAWGDCD